MVNHTTNAEIWSAEISPLGDREESGYALSNDGSTVFYYSNESPVQHVDSLAIHLWRIDSNEHQVLKLKNIDLLQHNSSRPYSYVKGALSPDGQYFALEYRSPEQRHVTRLVVWAVGENEPLHETDLDLPVPKFTSPRWRFSPDGSRMMTVVGPTRGTRLDNQSEPRRDDSRMLVLETKTGKELISSPIEPGLTSTLGGFSPDGTMIAATGAGKHVADDQLQSLLWVWDSETGKRICTIRPKSNQFRTRLVFSPDSKLICITKSGELFNARSGSSVGKLAQIKQFGPRFYPTHAKWTADGRSIEAVLGGEVLKWQLPSRQVDANDFTESGRVIVSVDGTHAGRIQVSPRKESTLYVYSVDGLRRKIEIPQQLVRWERLHAFSGDSRFVALSTEIVPDAEDSSEAAERPRPGSRDLKVTLWDVASGKQIGTLWDPSQHEEIVQVCSVPKRGLLAGVVSKPPMQAGPRYRVIIWDVASLAATTTINLPKYSAIAFSPDGKTVAIESTTSNAMNRLTIYDIDDGAKLSQFNVHPTPRTQTMDRLVFSSDGASIAALNAESRCIDLWDVKSGEKRLALQGASNRSSFTWSIGDDRLIAFDSTSSGQGQLMVWDTETGVRLLVHDDHKPSRSSLKRLADKNQIIAWPPAGPPRIWDATPESE